MIDTSVAHPARRYNYFLGGKDNFQADRDSGDAIARIFPTIRIAALENRSFLRRAVEFLVREAGVRQFLDIGTGHPDRQQHPRGRSGPRPGRPGGLCGQRPDRARPRPRAADQHAARGAPRTSTPTCANPEQILDDPELRATLDLSQPVALMLIAVLHFIMDTATTRTGSSARWSTRLPSGSYVAITNVTTDFMPAHIKAATAESSRRPRATATSSSGRGRSSPGSSRAGAGRAGHRLGLRLAGRPGARSRARARPTSRCSAPSPASPDRP